MDASSSSFLGRLMNLGRKLLLVDGIGAIISALCLFIALMQWDDVFGIPPNMLWILAEMAAIFSCYSLLCYFFAGESWRIYLWLILIANAVYGLLTLCIVLVYFETITILGLAYFVLELMVLSVLVYVEAKSLTMDIKD